MCGRADGVILLQYIGDAELRSTIQAATNKSESFNSFVKWLAFGGGGVIAENDRGELRKIIKYNHLLANCLIFHNVCMMTRVLHKLRAEGVCDRGRRGRGTQSLHSLTHQQVRSVQPRPQPHPGARGLRPADSRLTRSDCPTGRSRSRGRVTSLRSGPKMQESLT